MLQCVDAGFGFYEPGKAPLSIESTAPTTGFIFVKRTLEPEEYAYYYSFLNRDDIADSVKAGIAVVLTADLKLLYMDNFEKFKDPVLEKWVEKFKKLSGDDLLKAKAEITAFDNYLFQEKPPMTEYSERADQANLNFITNLMVAEKKKDKENAIQKLLDQEKTEIMTKKEQEELLRQKELVKKIQVDYMRNNSRKYLGAIFNMHPLSLNLTQKTAPMEFEGRMKVIKAIESKSLEPTKGFGKYKDILDAIYINPSQFKSKLDSVVLSFSHPMLRFK